MEELIDIEINEKDSCFDSICENGYNIREGSKIINNGHKRYEIKRVYVR